MKKKKLSKLCPPVILMCDLAEEGVLTQAMNEYDILQFG